MPNQIDNFKLETNFEGLILLLAKNLYSTPDVFVRELIANSHDAIQMRKNTEKNFAGRIDVIIDKSKSTISFMDNGIGMNADDLKNTLSIIGESSKRQNKEQALSQIGQFGIGLLSSFIVANKVIVRTKKFDSEKSFAWHNEGSLDCKLYSDDLGYIGTEVILFIRDEYSYIMSDERIKSIITKYCDFLPFPIYLNYTNLINDLNVPIYCDVWSSDLEKELKIKAFLDRRYPNEIPLDVIPFKISGLGSATGVLFISDKRIPGIQSAGIIDVFIKRMFIRENDNELLPNWAKFIKGIIDCPDLVPNAARDNFSKDEKDKTFKFIQDSLGDVIINRLCWLAVNDQKKLERINRWHHEHLKSMAVLNDEFMEKAGDLLFVETNEGFLPMEKYILKNERRIDYENKIPIYYFQHFSSASQFYNLAKSENWTIINAAYRYEEEFLKTYCYNHKDELVLINLDSNNDNQLFKYTEKENDTTFILLKQDIESHLNKNYAANIKVEIKKIDNIHLPAIVIDKPEDEIDKKISDLEKQEIIYGIELFKDIISLAKQKPTFTLIINADSHIINKLVKIDRRNDIVKEIISGLFISAILYSRSYLNETVSQLIYEQFTKFYEKFIKLYEDNLSYRENIDKQRKELMELKQQSIKESVKVIEHIQILFISSYEEEYDNLYFALKEIFENAPYFFEIISTKNFEQDKRLFDNVKILANNIDCVIADISDLHADVMFQLGIIKSIKKQDFPIILIKNMEIQNITPADIKSETFISYKSSKQDPALIEIEIKSKIEKENKPFNKDINKLYAQPRKHFLSRNILEKAIVRLDKAQIENTVVNFKTVEDFINEDINSIILKTKIEKRIIEILKDELLKQIKIEL
jgi:molecular chaperone HtpG